MRCLPAFLLAATVAGVYPGIRMSLTNQTVSNAFELYASKTTPLLEKNYGDFSKEFSYLDVKTQLTLHNTTLTSISYDPILTSIELQEPAFIILHLSNVSFQLDANYTLDLLLRTSGWFRLKESDSDLLLNISVASSSLGKPVFVLNGAHLKIGSADVSTDMDFALRNFVQRELNDHLQDIEDYAPQFLASVFPEVNAFVSTIPLQFPVYDDLMVDLSFVDAVEVAAKFLSFSFNGSFFSSSQERTQVVPRPLPPFGSMPEPIQLLLSDYAINSIFAAKWFSLSYFLEQLPPQFPIQMTTDELELFIPQLRNHFGADKSVAFSITPNKQAELPYYSTDGNVSLSFCADLEILCNPEGQGWESGITLAASIETSFTGEITNNVGDAVLWSISVLSLDVVRSSIGPIDINSLTVFLRTAVAQFIPQMNAFLSEVDLPLDQFLFFTILKDDATIEDGYLSAGVEVGLTVS